MASELAAGIVELMEKQQALKEKALEELRILHRHQSSTSVEVQQTAAPQPEYVPPTQRDPNAPPPMPPKMAREVSSRRRARDLRVQEIRQIAKERMQRDKEMDGPIDKLDMEQQGAISNFVKITIKPRKVYQYHINYHGEESNAIRRDLFAAYREQILPIREENEAEEAVRTKNRGPRVRATTNYLP